MTPLDKIKKGILNNDMEEVIDGYESLTGERVTRKEAEEIKSEKVPEQVREVSEEKVNKYEDFTAPVRRESSEKIKIHKERKNQSRKKYFCRHR